MNVHFLEIEHMLNPVTGPFHRNNAVIDEANYFDFVTSKATQMIEHRPKHMALEIPSGQKTAGAWILDLIEVPESFYDYKVVTSSGKEYYGSPTQGVHYRGVVRGRENTSMAAISIFDNELMGIVSLKNEGNFTIGKLKGENIHVMYQDRNLKQSPTFKCAMPDDSFEGYSKDILLNSASTNTLFIVDRCVRMYLETEFDIFQNLGSIAAVENYILGLMNQVALLYENEDIETRISELRIWDTTDPYNGSGIFTLLDEFQSQTNDINGDLGQLLTFRNIGGGVAAGFSGICNNDVDQRLSVSGISSTYNAIPTYSWSVYVITHEFGHLFGSRHTHACVWNGNNTAIDGCAGATEGGCSLPGNPAEGGTIMSYCHTKSVGIDFNLGFGTQPGNVIRNSVTNGNCLGACDCIAYQAITQPLTTSQTFSVTNVLTASSNISGGVQVHLQAGQEVRFLPGFAFKAANSGSVVAIATNISCREEASPISQRNDQTQKNILMHEKAATNLTLDATHQKVTAYPIPFTDVLTIQYIVDKECDVNLLLYDLLGNPVAHLIRQQMQEQGQHQAILNGSHLAPGIYLYLLQIGEQRYQGKVIKQ